MKLNKSTSKDTEIFTFGDLHGRIDLLQLIFQFLEETPKKSLNRKVIFLGDYIDRGPDSIKVIDALIQFKESSTDEVHFLIGNHEGMLRTALRKDFSNKIRDRAIECWLSNGGTKVLKELELLDHTIGNMYDLEEALGPSRIKFLFDLEPFYRDGNIMFVHAGIHPRAKTDDFLSIEAEIPIDELCEDMHWSWTRWEFLENKIPREDVFVVHGHSIVGSTDLTINVEDQISTGRLNIDYGAYHRGYIAAAIFRNNEVDLHFLGKAK